MHMTQIFLHPGLSEVMFFEDNLCSAPYQFNHKIQPFHGKRFLNTPCMRLLNFAENVGGVTGKESQHSLYNRQPRNPHNTFLLLSVFVSRPLMMVSSIGPTLHFTVPILTYSSGSSVFLLPSLSSVLSSPLPCRQSHKQIPFLISTQKAWSRR